jgi:ATP-dependent protease ClpP protease subunit
MWILLLLFLQILATNAHSNKVIKLNTTNNIILRGEINSESASKFIYDLNMMPNKNKTIVYLNTPGGSVVDGMKIVAEVQKYNLSCIADTAYSMGFIIFQACKNRYIVSSGRLMQHQMAFGVADQKNRVENYIDFINQMEDEIVETQAARINITQETFRAKITDDWWLYGENAVKENCADEVVNVECSRSLTKDTEIIEKGLYKYTYSKCPLVNDHIKKTSNKNADDIFFIPLF